MDLDRCFEAEERGEWQEQFGTACGAGVISVIEGKSGVWEKRNAIHKLGVAARANIVLPKRK